MPDETDDRVPLRAGAARSGRQTARLELFEETLIIRSPGQHREAVHLPVEVVAAYVDLRERRADRLPSALVGAGAPTVAHIGTGPGGRGTVGLVLREATALPAPDGAPWTADPRAPDAFDVLVLDVGRDTDKVLAALGRREPRRSPSLAAALVALEQEASGDEGRTAREMVTIATVGMVVVAAFALIMLAMSGQPTWLLLVAAAVPFYLYALSQAGAANRRRPVNRPGQPPRPRP